MLGFRVVVYGNILGVFTIRSGGGAGKILVSAAGFQFGSLPSTQSLFTGLLLRNLK